MYFAGTYEILLLLEIRVALEWHDIERYPVTRSTDLVLSKIAIALIVETDRREALST